MTLRYWESVGATLALEYPVVRSRAGVRRRQLIRPHAERRLAPPSEIDVVDQEVIVVQTKAQRLDMYLIGQAFFSAELMR